MPSTVPTTARAFPSAPRVDRYFGSESGEAARQRLTSCVERGEGPALLIGAAGCGKTMMLEVLSTVYESRMRVVRLAGAQVCTRRALMQSILHELGEPYRGLDDGEMRLTLSDSIAATEEQPVVILVDEAQSLPVRLLEELRLLSGAVVEGEPRVMLVLAGTNRLDETFTAPELDSFNQRIAARCYLHPLSREESIQYVRAHVAAVGGDPDALFTPDAYDALYQATDGTPRLLNQLGDRALVLAVERGEEFVNGVAIQEAWSDLHQLPAPWHTPAVVAPVRGAEDLTAIDEEDSVDFGEVDQEAVMTDFDAIPGIWNADEGLGAVAEACEQPEAPESACVAYSFPTRLEDPAAPTDTEPLEAPVDQNLEPTFKEAAASHATPEEIAANPFAETFDEEEVILDRYSQLEAVLLPGVARVENLREVEFGRMFEALTPAVESLIEEVESTLEEAVDGGLSLVSTETAEEPAPVEPEAAVAEIEEPVLVIEESGPNLEAGAAPLKYTRLFSKLRHA